MLNFNFDNHNIRTIEKEGDIWFVAKDVCDVLGIINNSDSIKSLDDDEKMGVGITDPQGREQKTSVVNESGLYHLVFKSSKPEAKRFSKWVRSEVLPQIRQYGHFIPRTSDQVASGDFEAYRRVAMLVGFDSNEASIRANIAVKKIHHINLLENIDHLALPSPKQEILLTPSDIAKRLGIKPRQGNIKLIGAGLQTGFRDAKGKIYYQITKKGNPYAKLLDTGKNRSDGTSVVQIKWYESVVEFLGES